MKIYQIYIKGKYINFGGEGKIFSQKVYRKEPSQKDINKFIDKCCNNKHPNDLLDLKEDTTEISIVE